MTFPWKRRARASLKVAIGLVAAFTAMILFFVIRGSGGSSGGPQVPAAPDPGVIRADQPARGPGTSRGGRIQLTDKKDPTRQIGELTYAIMDPLEAGKWDVQSPKAWYFLGNGWVIQVSADSGRLYIPDRNRQPESGTLTGNVTARAFPPKPDGARSDPSKDPPSVVATSSAATFDLNLGELSSREATRIVTGDGRTTVDIPDFKIIFSQVRSRLEFLEIKKGGVAVFTPAHGEKPAATASADHGPSSDSGAPETPGAQQPVAPAASVPVESLYAAVFRDAVTVSQPGRSVEADQLTVWARLLDNALPEGAIASFPSAPAETPAEPAGPPLASEAASGETPGVPAPAASPVPPEEKPFTLKWRGQCIVRPMESAPAELKDNDVAVRFVSESTGTLTFQDEALGLSGRSASLDYGATSRDLALSGPGPASIRINLPQREVEAVRAEVNLGTGIGTFIGANVFTETHEGAPEDRRRISSSVRTDFTLVTERGRPTGVLKSIHFQGDARASDRGQFLKGDSLRADFEPLESGKAYLQQLTASGNVEAALGENDRLDHADKLTATFRPGADGSEPEPASLKATGAVRMARGRVRVAAESVDATLQPGSGEDKRAEVVYAQLTGDARFTGEDGVTAGADEIRLRARDEVAELIGKGSHIARGDSSRIDGEQLTLEGKTGRVQVFGAGSFRHKESRRTAPGQGRVAAAWTRMMTFDDATGRLECFGDVTAESSPDTFTRERLAGEKVVLEFTPRDHEPAAPDDLDPLGSKRAKAERQLLKATVTGSVLEREGGANAWVLQERSAAEGEQPAPRRLYYLEAPQIIADNRAGTVDAPGAGRVVISDERAENERDQAAGPAADAALLPPVEAVAPPPAPGPTVLGDATSARGAALLQWSRSLHIERATSTLSADGDAALVHRRLEDGQITRIFADGLSATVRQKPDSPGQEADVKGGPGGLIAAKAVGSVYVSSAPAGKDPQREIAADRLSYDARTGIAEATSEPGNYITVFDRLRATAATARSATWNMILDTIELREPGPIVSPR